jgi:hypothetical protein
MTGWQGFSSLTHNCTIIQLLDRRLLGSLIQFRLPASRIPRLHSLWPSFNKLLLPLARSGIVHSQVSHNFALCHCSSFQEWYAP